jgi:hypothetical protein
MVGSAALLETAAGPSGGTPDGTCHPHVVGADAPGRCAFTTERVVLNRHGPRKRQTPVANSVENGPTLWSGF